MSGGTTDPGGDSKPRAKRSISKKSAAKSESFSGSTSSSRDEDIAMSSSASDDCSASSSTNGAASSKTSGEDSTAPLKRKGKKKSGRPAAPSKKKKSSGGPKYPIGTQLSKIFLTEDGSNQPQPFRGNVIGYDGKRKLYAIQYEDDDREEMTEKELSAYVLDGKKMGAGKAKGRGVGKRKNGKRGNYSNPDNEDDEDEDSDVEMGQESSENEDDQEVVESSKKVVKKPRLMKNNKKKTPSTAAAAAKPANELYEGKTPRRSAKSKINYADVQEKYDDYIFSEEEDDDSSMEEERPKKKKKGVANNAKKKGAKKKKKEEEDDDAFELDSEMENGVDDDDDDVEFDSSSEDDDDYIGKKKKSTSTKKRGGGTRKKSVKTNKKSETATATKKGKEEKKSMAESFKPQTNPSNFRLSLQEIESKYNFLDPCGMEATDDIISDRIIGEQVEKCLPLLEKALRYDGGGDSSTATASLGSKECPLVLGTACSGTDAPALALTLVQEQLEKRGKGDLFLHDHVFSCEKEAFKQAYLARNFDSVLYPGKKMTFFGHILESSGVGY